MNNYDLNVLKREILLILAYLMIKDSKNFMDAFDLYKSLMKEFEKD